ncbi:MAG: molybdopterin-dependent oxidoreductase [Coriobacteriia bacterium]|nr:molybdopterin-dependent oxidoreductase [Coriobacteriia bacterium]
MNRNRTVALALVVLLVLGGCAAGSDEAPAPEPDAGGGEVSELADVEITEYEGERLDSSDAFRENSISGPQDVDIEEYRLEVSGLVDDSASYTYSEITSGYPNFEKVVQLDCVEGWSAKVLWRGVLVRDILDASGVQSSAQSVIFSAADGYTTSFPVEYFYDNDIILAYAMNGVPLRPERGFPFQLVAEDKWGYKWCRWVTGIELSAEEDPGGYWEDRGYNNSGDLDKSFFGS